MTLRILLLALGLAFADDGIISTIRKTLPDGNEVVTQLRRIGPDRIRARYDLYAAGGQLIGSEIIVRIEGGTRMSIWQNGEPVPQAAGGTGVRRIYPVRLDPDLVRHTPSASDASKRKENSSLTHSPGKSQVVVNPKQNVPAKAVPPPNVSKTAMVATGSTIALVAISATSDLNLLKMILPATKDDFVDHPVPGFKQMKDLQGIVMEKDGKQIIFAPPDVEIRKERVDQKEKMIWDSMDRPKLRDSVAVKDEAIRVPRYDLTRGTGPRNRPTLDDMFKKANDIFKDLGKGR